MNTKLKHLDVNPDYQDLFAFSNAEEERKHNAQMISYRILSEVEKACEDQKINKKQLAMKIGASASYVTQLFRGAKYVNMDIMSRFEEALEFSFEIHIRYNTESQKDFVFNQVHDLGMKSCKHKQTYWYSMQTNTSSACEEVMPEEGTSLLFNLKSQINYKQKAS